MLYHKDALKLPNKDTFCFIERLKDSFKHSNATRTLFYFYRVKNSDFLDLFGFVDFDFKEGYFYACSRSTEVKISRIINDYKEGVSLLYISKEYSFKRI